MDQGKDAGKGDEKFGGRIFHFLEFLKGSVSRRPEEGSMGSWQRWVLFIPSLLLAVQTDCNTNNY